MVAVAEVAVRKGDWIETFTGRQFWPLDPRADEIDIEDIAHALSNICRFTGHVREFYSVAQHCCIVSDAVTRADALWGLLHDASEAYICDLALPVKRCPDFGFYVVTELAIMRAVCARFGLPLAEPADVKAADKRALLAEKRDVMGGTPWEAWKNVEPLAEKIVPMSPAQAKSEFLARFETLTRRAV